MKFKEEREDLKRMKGLHTAIVEFGFGDSAAKELGKETLVADNVAIDEANAIGSYVVGSAQPKENPMKKWWPDAEPILEKNDGLHRVLLDLDVPHVYIPSSTDGHGHLVIDVPQSWAKLTKLLQLLGDMGILQYGFVEATTNRQETWLRAPGVQKDVATEAI